MKKTTLQKLLALALAGAMTVGTLTACGNSNSGSSTPASSEASKKSEAPASSEAAKEDKADSEVAGIDGWEAFADNVTVKIPVYDRGVQGVPDVTNNYWTQWIQENFGDKYNITVEFVGIPRNDVMTKYAMPAASDDLPTILMEYDYPKQAQWAADGYLAEYDINEFAKVAPTYYGKMEELGILDYTEMDGKCYFALAERPYFFSTFNFVTFVRMDWLREVGYDYVPTKRAEVVDAMDKIMAAGLCEHPMGGSMVTGVGSDQNYQYREIPTNEEEWCMYGDYNIPSLGWEPNKVLLKYVNEDYNAGRLNPEYFVTDPETEKANFVNGGQYSYAAYTANTMDWLNSFYANNPDAELAVLPVMTEEDTEAGITPAWRSNNPFGMMIGFSSQASDDEIKAAWMYMEWLSQPDNFFTFQWGIEGENYNLGDDGLPVTVADYDGEYKQGYNNNKDYYAIVKEGRIAGDTDAYIRSLTPVGLPQDFFEEIKARYEAHLAMKDQYAIVDCMFGTEIASQGEYQQTLVELYKEYRDDLTMCKPEEFDTLYDQLAQKYMEAGYAEITEERLAAFNNGKTSRMQ